MRERVFRWREAFLALVALAVTVSSMNAENLDELRWKGRVLLIYVPEGSDKQFARQEELLRSHDAELREHDVTQIVLQSRGENPEIFERLKLSGAGFTLLLIGKDGGEKLRSHNVVAPETLCRLIDSMPMRQEEMRERASGSDE